MGEWISVKDRLPKNEEYVLVYDKSDGDINIMEFNITDDKRRRIQKWYFDDPYGCPQHENLTYWMPLPEPPR